MIKPTLIYANEFTLKVQDGKVIVIGDHPGGEFTLLDDGRIHWSVARVFGRGGAGRVSDQEENHHDGYCKHH